MNIRLFFQIILGAFGVISLICASVTPSDGGVIAGIVGIVLIAIFFAITL